MAAGDAVDDEEMYFPLCATLPMEEDTEIAGHTAKSLSSPAGLDAELQPKDRSIDAAIAELTNATRALAAQKWDDKFIEQYVNTFPSDVPASFRIEARRVLKGECSFT